MAHLALSPAPFLYTAEDGPTNLLCEFRDCHGTEQLEGGVGHAEPSSKTELAFIRGCESARQERNFSHLLYNIYPPS